MTATDTLFDWGTVSPNEPLPQIVSRMDSARTRLTDVLESHMAGDRSSRQIGSVRLAVLALIRQESMLAGDELNALYSQRWERNGWPQTKYDSPRKRTSELLADGLLMVCGRTDRERVFCLTPAGIEAVAS